LRFQHCFSTKSPSFPSGSSRRSARRPKPQRPRARASRAACVLWDADERLWHLESDRRWAFRSIRLNVARSDVPPGGSGILGLADGRSPTSRGIVMFDIRWIRDNGDAFDRALARRGHEPVAAKLIAL